MDNRDGTYDVKFDDGDRDREVPGCSIKKFGGSSKPDDRPTSGSGSGSSALQSCAKLSAGTRVEARYQGRTKYYPGKILRARISGKYDIAYDDGEREMQVTRDMIRVLDGAQEEDECKDSAGDNLRDSDSAAVCIGDKVEAHCMGSKKLYPGVVFQDNRDGTYYVKFDNGLRDRDVPKSKLSKISGGGERTVDDARSSLKLSEGDKVEARCKGSKKHYPGKIFMDNRDGTYDVKFDDGDRDREVPKTSIKKLGGRSVPEERPISGSRSSASQSGATLSAGTRVEARYQGRTQYYP